MSEELPTSGVTRAELRATIAELRAELAIRTENYDYQRQRADRAEAALIEKSAEIERITKERDEYLAKVIFEGQSKNRAEKAEASLAEKEKEIAELREKRVNKSKYIHTVAKIKRLMAQVADKQKIICDQERRISELEIHNGNK